jgi:hypothetical protein
VSPAAPTAYPKVPAKAWRTLRDRATTAPSTKFTPIVVASMLGMANPKSAADNILYPLRRLGLLNEDGALTDRGNKWRLNPSYAEACDEILSEVYPDELASLTDDSGSPDRAQVQAWFAHRGFGDSNASQMAGTYTMIAKKEIPEAAQGVKKPAAPKKPAKPKPAQTGSSTASSGERKPPPEERGRSAGPTVHLDIQVHIPSDATTEQIDQIFASMAKHLYQQ